MTPHSPARHQSPEERASHIDATGPEPPALERPAILVVDDDPGIRELFARAFEHIGYRIDTASCCREADARISRGPYDSIILDVRLPDDSGLAFYYRLKVRRPDLARRVVFLTGAIEFHPQLGFLLDEGRAVLLKPVSIPEVLEVLERTP